MRAKSRFGLVSEPFRWLLSVELGVKEGPPSAAVSNRTATRGFDVFSGSFVSLILSKLAQCVISRGA